MVINQFKTRAEYKILRIHNSTGKCDECDLQKGIVRKFRAHSFSAAVGKIWLINLDILIN